MIDFIKNEYIYYDYNKNKYICIDLSVHENRLLYLLNENKDKYVSMQDIATYVFGKQFNEYIYKSIRTLKWHLVKKLGSQVDIVANMNKGYKLIRLGE